MMLAAAANELAAHMASVNGTADRSRGGVEGGGVEGGGVKGGSVEGGSVEGGSVEGGSMEGGSMEGGSMKGGAASSAGRGRGGAGRGQPELNICNSADALWPPALRPPRQPYHRCYEFPTPPPP
jgi:hypothetical protein